MHILCLHGSGTSSQIFETQTAALRYELGDGHTYEFVQGTLPWPAAPGLAGFSDSKANFWAYFDNNDSASYLKALYQLNDYIEAEGPFDGVLAFSQGASLAAMHIVRKAVQEPLQPPPFKFAVLISCSSVYDPKAWLENGEVHVMQAEEVGTIINIPTAHIWGADDQFRDEAEGVKNLSRTDVASFVMHSGGHEVPRAISKKDLADCTKAMRRAVILATPCSE